MRESIQYTDYDPTWLIELAHAQPEEDRNEAFVSMLLDCRRAYAMGPLDCRFVDVATSLGGEYLYSFTLRIPGGHVILDLIVCPDARFISSLEFDITTHAIPPPQHSSQFNDLSKP